jgi:hypothetical protein
MAAPALLHATKHGLYSCLLARIACQHADQSGLPAGRNPIDLNPAFLTLVLLQASLATVSAAPRFEWVTMSLCQCLEGLGSPVLGYQACNRGPCPGSCEGWLS